MAFSPDETLSGPPVLEHQLQLFGLWDDRRPTKRLIHSNIVKDEGHANQIHNWLEEEGSDGMFCLLYRSTRDGMSGAAFHSKCDNQGSTLTIVETTDGLVFGGFSNIPWESSGCCHQDRKAFLFALSGNVISSGPYKMKLKDGISVYHRPGYGPIFEGFCVQGSSIALGELGNSAGSQRIKEMEVYQVTNLLAQAAISAEEDDWVWV